jgi:prepilin-type N-terminal cleavage/methylation domain-containing protein
VSPNTTSNLVAPVSPRKARSVGARPSRGYTLAEVVLAIAVLSVGAVGVVGMQKSVLIGNTQARNLSVANSIAQTWAERLRSDAMAWNAPNQVDDLGETRWLQAVNTAPGLWVVPTEFPGVGSPDADVLGADKFAADAAQPSAFCTHFRLTRLYPTLIRAEIRVFWERSGRPLPNDCANLDVVAVGADPGRFGFVYLTTGLAQNTAQ